MGKKIRKGFDLGQLYNIYYLWWCNYTQRQKATTRGFSWPLFELRKTCNYIPSPVILPKWMNTSNHLTLSCSYIHPAMFLLFLTYSPTAAAFFFFLVRPSRNPSLVKENRLPYTITFSSKHLFPWCLANSQATASLATLSSSGYLFSHRTWTMRRGRRPSGGGGS